VRPEGLVDLHPLDIDGDDDPILVYQRATPGGGRPDKPGVPEAWGSAYPQRG
jgi:hypothetical protein